MPALEDTCRDFVESVATLISPEALASLRSGLQDFCATNGLAVQKLLLQRAKARVRLCVCECACVCVCVVAT